MRKFKHPRYRHMFFIMGGLLVIGIFLLLDPKMHLVQLGVGANAVVELQAVLKTVWYVGLLYATSRAIFDFVDFEQLFQNASTTSEGAGRALIGVSLFSIAIAICLYAAVTTA